MTRRAGSPVSTSWQRTRSHCRGYYEPPPVICYLDRGHGAAIRRARTRLPGGGENPVAIIRVPRERMVGSGIASSLVHEVGHQASALLDLVNSLRPVLIGCNSKAGGEQVAWKHFRTLHLARSWPTSGPWPASACRRRRV